MLEAKWERSRDMLVVKQTSQSCFAGIGGSAGSANMEWSYSSHIWVRVARKTSPIFLPLLMAVLTVNDVARLTQFKTVIAVAIVMGVMGYRIPPGYFVEFGHGPLSVGPGTEHF